MSKNGFNNKEIFEYLKPNDNTLLSEFDEYDLYDTLRLINQYYLEFRRSLGLNERITYGFELEFESIVSDCREIEKILVTSVKTIRQ